MSSQYYPIIERAKLLDTNARRLLICAFGFEERSLAWTNLQRDNKVLTEAYVIKYQNPKGKNKIIELKKKLKALGVTKPIEQNYSILGQENIESIIEQYLAEASNRFDEIVIDITALTKFLILIFLCKLEKFNGIVKIIYTEAEEYAPSESDYNKFKDKVKKIIAFPSKGFGTILRARCLSSIRMQGQPVTLVAFTSFNEQLVRHMLGTISPHLLILINGKPLRSDYDWRELATLSLHAKLIAEYPIENEKSETGQFARTASTLYYEETIEAIDSIYSKISLRERIIVAATGSKMQTVGLFFSKIKHPDIHVEYPTPDSYYVKGFSSGYKNIYEMTFQSFKSFIDNIKG